MLTIFAIPKPFVGHLGIIQRNAITSWKCLEPPPEIMLLGNEDGVGEIARELDLGWIPEIACTPFGTPLLGDGFRKVRALAKFPLLVYVNCDIMFTQSLIDAIRGVDHAKFLAVGRRTNIDLDTSVAPAEMRDRGFGLRLAAAGKLETPFAIDYFIFPACAELCEIPGFAVGRPGWDNWMIYNALAHRLPVIDATARITALHQNHHYQHVPMQRGMTWEGPEADHNRVLAGSRERLKFSLLDATHRFSAAGMLVATPGTLARGLRLLMARHPLLKWPLKILGLPFLLSERRQRRRAKIAGYR
ncbi:MAG: hypothetical protein NTW21_11840 [Verrucomicrobia bacterium]|nr:hypothetical protein [Verrucomicrobiota bacterium]